MAHALASDVEIAEEPITMLAEYARVPIAFAVRSVFDVTDGDALAERVLDAPYIKDYDRDYNPPTRWPDAFDLSNWGLIAARLRGRWVGGATVAFDTPGVTMLEGRRDLAVLWDIRVAPESRGEGIGSALFRAVEGWALARGCRLLKIETQNVNVGACRFYERHGCSVRGVRRGAYPEFPNEVQLLWYKDLRNDD